MKQYDVIIIGAGASGLFAGMTLATRNRNTLILDKGDSVARKVAISGGGNCNFTNLSATKQTYYGKNPAFVCSALAQFSPTDMLNFIKTKNIEYIESEPNRLFCKNGANHIIDALFPSNKYIHIKQNTNVINIQKENDNFIVITDTESFKSQSVIVATGGLSYQHLCVSDIGYKIAKQFGHKIIPTRPALCAIKTQLFDSSLMGISVPVEINIQKHKITDSLLFTHFGLGGPAIYRSTLFDIKDNFYINFCPNINITEILKTAKYQHGKKTCSGILSDYFPNKFAKYICDNNTKNIADWKGTEISDLATKLTHFCVTDAKLIGFQSAEVTFGGVDTSQISSKTMESKLCKNLFFVGEVLDITGDLGGFNLQWAFSSGYVAGLNA